MLNILFLIALLAVQDTSVDQIGVSSPMPAPNNEITHKTDTSVGQLSGNLDAKWGNAESDLSLTRPQQKTLAMEVVEAWQRIRASGQTPTPDLIGQDIGQDKLAIFLASSPLAANVIVTGELPDNERPAPGSAGRDVTTAYAGDNAE